MIDEHPIRTRYQAVRPLLDERGRRLHVAAEAVTAGRGGVAAASRATKVARSTIGRGLKDLSVPASLTGRIRRKGAGRPTATAKDPTLLDDLRQLLEPATMGDPMRPLRWVSKSHEKLATALREKGHKVSASSLPKLLEQLEYRRHVNRKTKDGSNHPDRDAQFEHIDAKAREFQAADQPVISVDTKKKELLGEFKNAGSDYGPKGKPIEVDAHDFENKELGKVVPYGVYDVGANSGYVSLGVDHDTAVRGQRRPSLARQDGPRALPGHAQDDGHGRLWRFKRSASPTLEDRTATACRRDRADLSGLPLPAWHLEVEQDRASHVLPYHTELACHTAYQSRCRGRTHRQHQDQNRSDHPLRTRHQNLSEGHQSLRPGDGNSQSQGRRVPSGLELRHLAQRSACVALISGYRLNV